MKIKVIIEKGEDGFYSARCPALRSCWSQGRTRDEALLNIREAIELYLNPKQDTRVFGIDRLESTDVEGL